MSRASISFCIACFFISFFYVSAQEDRVRYGLYGNAYLNIHTSSFKELPGVPTCCPQYTEGTGSGLGGGFLLELPLFESALLSLRLGYADFSGLIESSEKQPTANGLTNFTHELDASLPAITFHPLVGYEIFSSFRLHGGLDFSYLMPQTYTQKEVVADPNGVFVPENSRERNVTTGDIQERSSFMFSPLIGASYEFPMNTNKTMLLCPEIYYQHGFTNVNSTLDWKVSSVRFGLALKFSPKPLPPPKPEPIPEKKPEEVPKVIVKEEPKPVEPKIEPLHASVRAVGVDEKGKEFPVGTIKVEEFLSTQMRPLLNYIFFDENSDKIDKKYTYLSSGQSKTFSVQSLFNSSTMETYYHVMNIVGKRLTENPKAKLTITGCNADLGTEKNNTDLSRRRAESVKQYLVNNWNIDPSRLSIAFRNLSEKPSNNNEADGVVENRRVELQSDDWAILEPLVLTDTLRTTNPPVLRFYPSVQTLVPLNEWNLSVSQQSKVLKEFSGTGGRNVTSPLEWNFNEEKTSIPLQSQPLEYTLSASNTDGQSDKTEIQTIPLEQVTIRKKRSEQIADREIDRYSLILFDYDKADLGNANKRIIDFVKPRIAKNATVSVAGFTDRTGDDAYNKTLSSQRASNAMKALGKGSAVGEGEKVLFDNNTPEGRFYNRTVTILVETPISK